MTSTKATSPMSTTRTSSQAVLHRGGARRVRREGGSRHPEVMRELERVVLLNITDTKWREHLYEMDYLQEGIHLRSYAQKDPLTEYRREAYDMFPELTESIRDDFVRYIYRVEFVRPEAQQSSASPRLGQPRGRGERRRREAAAQGGNPNQVISDKMPRNAPCPCGSGKKYKKCHGAVV